MKRITIEVEDKFHTDFKEIAVRKNRTIRQVITEIMSKWMDRNR